MTSEWDLVSLLLPLEAKVISSFARTLIHVYIDMQTVSLTLRVLHRPEVAALPTIYSRLGLDYDERVLPSIGNEVLKATVAQFDAGELITQRELVSAKIQEELVKRASEFNIMLEDVSLTHLSFGKDFTKAVEEKQIGNKFNFCLLNNLHQI